MLKLIGALTAGSLLIFAAGNSRTISKVALAYAPSSLTEGSASQTVATPASPVVVQDQDPQEPEGSKHCERPSKSNPDVGEKDPNKMGCGCQYKCVNGKPEEDRSDPAKKCKNDCKKDQCDCTKPSCKS